MGSPSLSLKLIKYMNKRMDERESREREREGEGGRGRGEGER